MSTQSARHIPWIVSSLFVILWPSACLAQITQAALTSDKSTANNSSYTSASITPTANRLVIAVVVNTKTSAVNTPTLSGNGLTYVQIATQADGGAVLRVTMFRAMGASPAAGAVTIDFAGTNQTGCAWSIYEFAGMDTSGTNGSGAVVQSAINTGTATSGSVTLAAFGSATNGATSGWGIQANQAITNETGWTEIIEQGFNTPTTALETQWRANQDTSPTATWTSSVAWVGIAIEIKEAVGRTRRLFLVD